MMLSRRKMLAMMAAGRLGAGAHQLPTFRAEARLVEIHATVFRPPRQAGGRPAAGRFRNP